MSVIDRLNHALEGRYRLLRPVGEGGMAMVFLAEDVRHDRRVALKVLKPELSADVDVDRFLSEIRTTAGLQHPHILPLFDSGEADGLLYYVMPFVEGETLRSRLERTGAFSVDEAIAVSAQIADAMQYAHGRGVLHRDLKPSNIMMSEGGPLLADFGIALALGTDRDDRLTRTGTSIGTPGYMSPEQAAGEKALGEPADIYSLGALSFELLTGTSPFGGSSPRAALARLLTEDAPEASSVNPSVPVAVSRVVAGALARDPRDRPASAEAFARDLRAALPATRATSKSRGVPRTPVAIGVMVVLALAAFWYVQNTQRRWARVEAIPEVQRLLGLGENAAAFQLAERALEVLPDDPVLVDLFDAAAVEADLASVPEGAAVSYRPFDVRDTVWTEIGTTPLRGVSLPQEELLVRYALDGYRPFLASIAPSQPQSAVTLVADTADAMIALSASTFAMTGDVVSVDGFSIDEYEVTNEAYQVFLDVALEWDSAIWVAPFRERGVAVDLGRMRTELVDQTGRPGPATWELSRYPTDRADYPVQGVSWFEAVAYCAFVGKELPTYYHWKVADAGSISPWDGLLQHANLSTDVGPRPVGSLEAVSVTGVSDLAGNVREWVWNASEQDRYVLGGSWLSPPHIYLDFDAADPWSRSPENGFRCARFPPPSDEVVARIDRPIFDFRTLQPVDDQTFASFRAFYAYDRAPLRPTSTVVEEAPRWVRELVEIDAPYLDERIAIHVFLPANAEPPYQATVYMPGASAFALSSSKNIPEMAQLMFLPESGRALLYPVIKGTYERRHGRPSRGMAELRQRYIWMVQDIMRTMDYVEEREDLDVSATAYLGLSFGAELAIPVALEKRFGALVLIGGALDPAWRGAVPEEAAPWNFVSRITTPTLLINGEFDFMHPFEEGQVPFFDLIDVPDEDKEFVVLPTGHLPPNNDVIGHTLRWLDARLGPVRRR
ncbi:MAG: protein kinase [Gemmatimonadota bacterium]|nr:protein kinase [Gemmatimonadota bacterium]